MKPTEATEFDNRAVAQRLHDMARVGGRLAHDFDNVLTGVIGFAELTQPLVPAGTARQHLSELHRVGVQGIELTKRLHQLSRAAGITPKPTDVGQLLNDLERRLRTTTPGNVNLQVQPLAKPTAASIDPDAIRSVLDELLANAIEACTQGGSVRVSVESRMLTAADAASLMGQAAAGPHVVVTIADTGLGFAPDVRARLFMEACLTTKPRHRGLGLAIVYRILHAHHAGFSIGAGPAGGTAVRVFLPQTQPVQSG